jgi:hypothetical protein
MAGLIEQQDDFWSGPVAIPIGSVGGGSGRPMIEGFVVSILATACALLAKQTL